MQMASELRFLDFGFLLTTHYWADFGLACLTQFLQFYHYHLLFTVGTCSM